MDIQPANWIRYCLSAISVNFCYQNLAKFNHQIATKFEDSHIKAILPASISW